MDFVILSKVRVVSSHQPKRKWVVKKMKNMSMNTLREKKLNDGFVVMYLWSLFSLKRVAFSMATNAQSIRATAIMNT
jgi:hypothetical protein